MLSGYGHSSYICGDININLLKNSTKSLYNTFFKNMLSSGFYPKITLPTRICNTSSAIIEKFKHGIKQTWSIINETLHCKRKNSLSRVSSHNGRILKEPVEIANAFNRYFIDIGPSLANQNHTHHNYKEFLRTLSKNQTA